MSRFNVSLDLGNGHIKGAHQTGETLILDSVSAIPSPGLTLNHDSCIIEYLQANHDENENYVGQRRVIGSSARNEFQYVSTFNTEKYQTALFLGLSVFKPSQPKAQRFEVENLVVSLPEPDAVNAEGETAAELLRRTFEGEHVFRYSARRRHTDVTLNIQHVSVEREGYGSFLYAQAKGLVPDDVVSVVIDLGRKTCIILPIDEDGDIMPDASVFRTGGTYELAVMIGRTLRSRIGGTPNTDAILEALRHGKLVYGVGANAIDFSAEYDDLLYVWWDNILGYTETVLDRFMHRVGLFLITGGSAALIRDLFEDEAGNPTDPMFRVAPEPQLANVLGLLQLAEPDSPDPSEPAAQPARAKGKAA